MILRAGLNPVCMCRGDLHPLGPVTVLTMVKRQSVLCSLTGFWCAGSEDTAVKRPRFSACFVQALHPPQEINHCPVWARMPFRLHGGYLLSMLKQGRAGCRRLCESHGWQSLQHHVLHDDLVHLGILHQHHLYHIWEKVTPRRKVRPLSATDRQQRHLGKKCRPAYRLVTATMTKQLNGTHEEY